ncbi:HU family DNA-binding protein, partial [Ornithobacterium rhinotracheale]
MSIKNTEVEIGQPFVKRVVTNQFYGNVVNDGEYSIDDLVTQIEKLSALSEADIRGVFIALENVIQD